MLYCFHPKFNSKSHLRQRGALIPTDSSLLKPDSELFGRQGGEGSPVSLNLTPHPSLPHERLASVSLLEHRPQRRTD